jgi:phosphoglucomutase
VTTVDRLAIVAQIVQANADLEKQASAARKQLISQALADRMTAELTAASFEVARRPTADLTRIACWN